MVRRANQQEGSQMGVIQGRISSKIRTVSGFLVGLLGLVPVLCMSRSAAAQAFTELYAFNTSGNLSDGGSPEAGVTRDAAGNLYGTTFFGGVGTGCDIYFAGCGTVFKVDTSGTETVLHSFGGAHDGWNPTARLILDESGNLYGTTGYGGAHGYGTVFKVDKAGNETIIHSFAGGTEGDRPNAGLVEDAAGNLYGTTQYGGRGCDGRGCGTVFRISPDGRETVLYRFADLPDGASPMGGVALDASGNIYGTTWLGGAYSFGTVFKIDICGREKVLHSFAGGSDGANPLDAPVLDKAGNMYGTTASGGASGTTPLGLGTLFKVDTAGHESIVYTFTGGSDGANPYAHLLADAAGNLYGTATSGGVTGNGTVFEFSDGGLTPLYGFSSPNSNGENADGQYPMGGLITDSAGNLYGTTVQAGTNGWGSVFELQP
jgi:uncharacterized repeat protein (TIGR03803 family)